MNIKKAVITAAARGERLYPVADTVQKAMLPIVDTDGINKPIIQIIAEEALLSGIEEICIICAPGDEERYIDAFQSLHSTLLSSHKHSEWAQKQAANIKNLLSRLSFKVQNDAFGYGHAVYQAKQFVNNEPFLLLLGDYLYVSDIPAKRCAQQLIDLSIREDCSASAVNPTIEHSISRYGTLTGKTLLNYNGVYQVEKIIEKPSISEAELHLQTPGLRAGYYLCFSGMHILKSNVFELLSEAIEKQNNTPSKNILLTPIIQKIAENEKYLALEMKGTRYDTSKKLGLLQAQIALGLAGNLRDEVLTCIIETMSGSIRR